MELEKLPVLSISVTFRDSVQSEDGQSYPSTVNNGSLTATIRSDDFSFFPPVPERPDCTKTLKNQGTIDEPGKECKQKFNPLGAKAQNTVEEILNQFKALVSIGDPNKKFTEIKQIGKG